MSLCKANGDPSKAMVKSLKLKTHGGVSAPKMIQILYQKKV
jgi:hypothetical protein